MFTSSRRAVTDSCDNAGMKGQRTKKKKYNICDARREEKLRGRIERGLEPKKLNSLEFSNWARTAMICRIDCCDWFSPGVLTGVSFENTFVYDQRRLKQV